MIDESIPFRRISIPKNAHPLVRQLFAEMNNQQVSFVAMNKRSGIGKDTMKHWRDRSSPNIVSLEACFNVLGFEVIVVPKKEEK